MKKEKIQRIFLDRLSTSTTTFFHRSTTPSTSVILTSEAVQITRVLQALECIYSGKLPARLLECEICGAPIRAFRMNGIRDAGFIFC
nr:hypothetical protein Iba_chr14bCG4380 [Ipomoea batatas]